MQCDAVQCDACVFGIATDDGNDDNNNNNNNNSQ